MKITEVTTVTNAEFPNLLHVRVGTADGVTGLGETFYFGASVAHYIHDVVAPLILNQDALDRTRINAMMEGYVGYTGSGVENRARSAIDIALWDIAGKIAGLPIYDLLGGRVHDQLRAYNTCAGSHYMRSDGQAVSSWGLDKGRSQYEDLERALTDAGGLAQELLAAGISAMKIWPFDPAAEANLGRRISVQQMREALAPIAAIRQAVGQDMDILVELHALWSPGGAREIARALEEYGIYWIEDPVRADFVPALADLREKTSIPIAVGETVAGKPHFGELINRKAADILTLDIGWCGGLTEAVKVAGMAEAAGVWIAPHDCTGPVGLAIATQLATASRSALIQETVRASYFDWYPRIAEGGPLLESGFIRAPSSPGLGVELTSEYLGAPDTIQRSSHA